MAEIALRDRLQPSLLDRLTDHHPTERRETAEERVLSRQQLRAAILRDLSWLFNAARAEPEPTSRRKDELLLWSRHEHARRSVLNYGMPAFSGNTMSSLDRTAMQAAIKQAITLFEPRIDAKSITVQIHVDHRGHHNTLQLTIRANMWAQPMPLELLLTAAVDLETGDTSVRDMRG